MRGRLLRRYQRFLADIETETGEVITAYCPATGRLTSCYQVGAPVEYTRVEKPGRKLDYDWWSIRMDSSWVVIDTRPAPDLVRRHQNDAWAPPHWKRARWEPEPSLEEGGRLDFRLCDGEREEWIEVKSVTWCRGETGLFPDAPTRRGRRHLRELIKRARRGQKARLVMVSMRSDVRRVKPSRLIDPEFARLLGQARKEGVSLMGLQSRVGARDIQITGRIPVECR